ncbi:Rec8 like protein-domain-containing protein [Flammula alnicola]|nr:Rec8 like protein-domain-containing protein [Flammula alnicola]
MFYSETILSRRGPLGRVWLAAHMERKLSKSQTLQTDIEQSVDAIMGQEIELMALRLSGQLLLGVVRIYSRKAKYLLDDCNEALLKIKMAFRPGVVDLTEDQLTVNKTAITLQTNGLGLDLLLPDVDWDMDFEDRPLQRQGHHQAHVDDITLRTADDFHQFGDNDPFDIGPSDGIGSQDFNDLDLGIHWDDEQNEKSEAMSVDGSVGVGRDAQIHGDSFDSDLMRGHGLGVDLDVLSHRSKSRDVSEQPFGTAMDIDVFPDVDLGDLGIGFDDLPPDVGDVNGRTPSQTRSLSRASSPLTELPVTPPPFEDLEANPEVIPPTTEKAKRKLKDKKQIIDSVTELQNGTLASNRGRAAGNANPLNTDTSGIVSKHHFLPRSSIVMRLLEIRDDPVTYFLPTQTKANGNFFSAAPPGLTQELADLFMRPLPGASPQKRKGSTPGPSPSKRARREEVEVPRRAGSLAPSEGVLNEDLYGQGIDGGFEFADQSGAMEDYQLDVPEVGVHMDEERAKSVVTDRSRLSSLEPELEDGRHEGFDGMCPISMFDVSQPSQPTQSQAVDKDQDQVEPPENDKHGYSKNTVKALGLIRKELQPTIDNDAEANVLSFKKIKPHPSSFFFELLVLGTRDCVQLSQSTPFADIEVQAKPRLWEHQQHMHGDVDRTSESA